MATTKNELKQIVEAALNALDADFSVFDIVPVGAPADHWTIAFFDRRPADGRRIFQIGVQAGQMSPDAVVREEIASQLANRLVRRAS